MSQTLTTPPVPPHGAGRDLVVLEGWSHYELYDKPEPVGMALAKLIPFYQDNL